MDDRHLFVYGTLLSSFENEFARLLAQAATLLGRARIPARLYRFDHYPAAVLSAVPGDWVFGELYRLDAPASTLAVLDAYEDTGPAGEPPALFHRTGTIATLDDSTRFSAWVYVYNRPISGSRRILSGDYLDEPALG
jgi:gamma-glutamylcyclotransferase (GGCT)/AIG2-like uncharacterized protein YtfP